MNIVDAIKDEKLFKPFFGDDLTTWRAWLVALRVLYGIPFKKTDFACKLIRDCTGRDPYKLPREGFQTALFLTGRRSGKSRMAAIIGAYSAVLSGQEKNLAAGEMGLTVVISPSMNQSRIVKGYQRAVFDAPMLKQEIASDLKWHGCELKNGNRIELLAGDYRKVRGFSLLTAVIDEVCFMGIDTDEKTKARSDTEIVRAIEPALSTTGGKLIAISSTYAKRGWAYTTFKENFGNDKGEILVWKAPSRTMNSTLKQSYIDKALRKDYAAAKSEYLAEFRDDVGIFLPEGLITDLVVPGRIENTPITDTRYTAFADISGGRNDASALAIAHREGRKIILDSLSWYRAPHNPYEVIGQMSKTMRAWGISQVTADNYAAEFAASAFKSHGILFREAEKKSKLYAELLPIICAREIELLDDKRLIKELCQLERRTRSGGNDLIDHPLGCHDDLANAVAGVVVASATKRIIITAGGF